MGASKPLIQLGSSLRAIQVGSTTNTPPLRRTSVNSYRFLSSNSSGYDQGFDLVHLQSEITKLKREIEEMRKEIREMRDHLRYDFKNESDVARRRYALFK